jgi:hypothetical protein
MKIILRVVAFLIGFAVLFTLLQVLHFSKAGAIGILARSGIGIATLVSWMIILTCGPIAAVQLWRFRKIGLYLGAMLSGLVFLYYLGGLITSHPKNAALRPILTSLVANGTVVAVLLSRKAQQICEG